MGNAVVVHDLHPSQLVVGCVNFTAQHLVRINTNTDQSLLTQELLRLALSQTPAQACSLWVEAEFPPLSTRLMLKQMDPAFDKCIGLAKQVSNQLKPVSFCPEMGPAPGARAKLFL